MFQTAPQARQQDAKNDRKYYRLQVNFPIDIHIDTLTKPVPATLGDISEGGCGIISKSMLLRGAPIAFDLPREGKQPLRLQGTVASIDFKQNNRMFHYGIQYRNLRPADSDAIYQFIVEQQRRGLRSRNEATEPQKTSSNGSPLRSVRERSAYRVETNFPVRYTVIGVRGSNAAMAVDVSIGGMRIAFDRKLQLDRELDLRFTLPSNVLDVLTRHEASRSSSIFGREIAMVEVKARQFTELQVHAKLLPAMEEVKGRYFYSVNFVRATAFVAEELQRFVHAAQLTELQKKRIASGGGTRLL